MEPLLVELCGPQGDCDVTRLLGDGETARRTLLAKEVVHLMEAEKRFTEGM